MNIKENRKSEIKNNTNDNVKKNQRNNPIGKIRNEDIKKKCKTQFKFEELIKEQRLRLFGNVKRSHEQNLTNIMLNTRMEGDRGRSRQEDDQGD